MANWQIEAGSTKQSLEAWGLADDAQLVSLNQQPDTLSLTEPEAAVDDAPLFTWKQPLILWRDAAVRFRGKVIQIQGAGGARSEGKAYTVAGPWWDLTQIVFQQTWNVYVDSTHMSTTPASEVFLGRAVDGTWLNSGAQIAEALNWANNSHNPTRHPYCGPVDASQDLLQIGTIDPAVNFPFYNTRDLTCAEVITQMLRFSPDVVCWFDYSTSPPTFYARKLANHTNVNVTVGTDELAGLNLRPRYDLQLPAVILHFKWTSEIDGKPAITWSTQSFARDGGGSPIVPTGYEPGATVHTIELGGCKLTRATAKLTTLAILARDGTEANRIAWWKNKVHWLKNPTIDPASLHITVANVFDENGTDITSTALGDYPQELKRGQIADWMGFNRKTIEVKALATFDNYRDTDHTIPTRSPVEMPIHVKIHATNAPVGTDMLYWSVKSYEEPEPEPANLAQNYYDSRAVLQQEGQLSWDADEVPAGIGMGKKLTLLGLATGPSNLMLQQISERICYGQMTVQFGPATQLGLADLIEMLRMNRYRQVYNAPSSRSTGQPAGEGEVEMGQDMPKENSTEDNSSAEISAVSAADGDNKAVVLKDARSQSVEVKILDPLGVEVPGAGSIKLKLSDCVNTDVKMRPWPVTVAGVAKTIYVASSDVPDGVGSGTSVWL